jgi:hypothetical protein
MKAPAFHDRAIRRLHRTARGLVCGLGLALLAQPAGGERARPDYAAFRVITERNIFNAGRSGRVSAPSRENRRPSRVDTVSLVGVMTYEKGPFAFFDGSSSEYRKALQPGGAVADLKLLEVRPNSVQLAAGTNLVELRVGAQLRREELGAWQLAERAGPLAGPGSSTGDSSGSAGADDEVLKRLLQKREQETR